MPRTFPILHAEARSILSHVPTLGIYGRLNPEDFQHCVPLERRLHATHAPLLPCDPEKLAEHAIRHWLQPESKSQILERVRTVANAAGRSFGTEPEAFSWLSKN